MCIRDSLRENSSAITNAFIGGRDIAVSVVNAYGCYSNDSDSLVSSLSAKNALSQGAYAMNTYGEKFKDSAKWTMDGTLVRQTSYSEQASHKITFSAVAQTIEAFHLARELNYNNINMDLIVGLPGEDISKVKYTLEKVKELSPDSLTVHSLAVKRAARLNMFKLSLIHI